ncbi:hypothetical protein KAZ57_02185 [Patescibacteria group bacterium]|nr:hypothetical protein [Patescibacteria group bacterium]
MENFLIWFFAIVAALLVVREINKRSDPFIRAAAKTAGQIKRIRALASKMPEGNLLQVQDYRIQSLGEAMLIEGASTKEINAYMLEQLTIQLTEGIPANLVRKVLFTKYPLGKPISE